jgi:hypothetical protein
LSLGAQVAPAQTRTIRYEVKCATCRIVREKVASLGHADDSVLIIRAHAAGDSRGRFFVPGASNNFVVFDAAGRFVTAVGRAGRGPGEFPADLAGVMVGLGDTLYAFDLRRNVHIFTPALKFVRTLKLPTRYDRNGAILNDGRILLQGQVSTPEAIGFPYHLFAPDGRVAASFGPRQSMVRPGEIPTSGYPRPPILRRDQRGVWTTESPAYEYGITSWRFSGEREASIQVRDVKWMAAAKAAQVMGAANPVHEDPEGRLWVQARVVDPKYDPTKPLTAFPVLSQRYDNIIDVFDTQTWTLLASARFDEHLHPLGNTGMMYSVREDSDGIMTLDVWRLRLTQASP